MERIPFTSHKEIFDRLANVGNVATLSKEDRVQYEHDLKKARDYNAEMRFACQEARADERFIIASKLFAAGVDMKTISEGTGISMTELQGYLNSSGDFKSIVPSVP